MKLQDFTLVEGLRKQLKNLMKFKKNFNEKRFTDEVEKKLKSLLFSEYEEFELLPF